MTAVEAAAAVGSLGYTIVIIGRLCRGCHGNRLGRKSTRQYFNCRPERPFRESAKLSRNNVSLTGSRVFGVV